MMLELSTKIFLMQTIDLKVIKERKNGQNNYREDI